MKKKNGFTLVELLVVIALMLSILGISVVSFITISNKKKEDAWEEVKSQIEVAAKQYFSSNEYLFEGLSEGTSGTISVGTLVDNDYLNAVTNPMTGKLISKCSVVNVTKNGSKYNAVFDNGSITSAKSSCDTHYILVSESGGPKITASVTGTEGNGNWYLSEATVTLKVEENGNGSIDTVGICYDDNCSSGNLKKTFEKNDNNSYTDSETYGVERAVEKTSYMAINENDKKAYVSVELGVDMTAPTLIVNMDRCEDSDLSNCKNNYSNNTWINKYVNTSMNASDNGSGIDYSAYHTTGKTTNKEYVETKTNKKTLSRGIVAQGTSYIKYKACDKAGNCTYSDVNTIKLDRTKPTVALNGYVGTNKEIESLTNDNLDSAIKKLSKRTNQNNWINKNNAIVLKTSSEDELSGIKSITCTDPRGTNYGNFGNWRRVMNTSEGTFTFNCTTYDNAGNKGTTSYVVKREVNVTISFESVLTNKTIGDSDKTTAKGEKVFANKSGICGYGKCSNIMCYTDSNKENKCPSDYFARACRYVDTYPRFFKVKAASYNDGKETIVYANDANSSSIKIDNTTYYKNSNLKRSTDFRRYNATSKMSSKYYYKNVGTGKDGLNDFSAHVYTFTTPAGNSSSGIRLYTEYATDCGYKVN